MSASCSVYGHKEAIQFPHTLAVNSPFVFPHHLIRAGFICLPRNLSDLNSFTCGHLHREQELFSVVGVLMALGHLYIPLGASVLHEVC